MRLSSWVMSAYWASRHYPDLPSPPSARSNFLHAGVLRDVGRCRVGRGWLCNHESRNEGHQPSTPEIRTRSRKSGKTYEVEAKRKERWTSPTNDVRADSFKSELKRYVRGRIYNTSRKKLNNPILWIELSIPTPMSEADGHTIGEMTHDIVRNAD